MIHCSDSFEREAGGARWVDVSSSEDIPLRGARRVRIGDRVIAIFRTANDRFHALLDACPHRAGPLSEGIVHGHCVTCPLHNWTISLEDGQAQGADKGGVKTFPVRLANSRVQIRVEEQQINFHDKITP